MTITTVETHPKIGNDDHGALPTRGSINGSTVMSQYVQNNQLKRSLVKWLIPNILQIRKILVIIQLTKEKTITKIIGSTKSKETRTCRETNRTTNLNQIATEKNQYTYNKGNKRSNKDDKGKIQNVRENKNGQNTNSQKEIKNTNTGNKRTTNINTNNKRVKTRTNEQNTRQKTSERPIHAIRTREGSQIRETLNEQVK